MNRISSKKSVTVTQQEDEPVPHEVLAGSIRDIAKGLRKLTDGPLNEKALVLLIQHAAPRSLGGSPISATDVRAVLQGIKDLEKTYLKPA